MRKLSGAAAASKKGKASKGSSASTASTATMGSAGTSAASSCSGSGKSTPTGAPKHGNFTVDDLDTASFVEPKTPKTASSRSSSSGDYSRRTYDIVRDLRKENKVLLGGMDEGIKSISSKCIRYLFRIRNPYQHTSLICLAECVASLGNKVGKVRDHQSAADKALQAMVKRQQAFEDSLRAIQCALVKAKTLDVNIHEYVPFTNNDTIEWFFNGGPSTRGVTSEMRQDALTNYVVGGLCITSRYASGLLKFVLTEEYIAAHVWPTTQ